MNSVTKAVADLTREDRRELWPRYTARRAGVSTAEARDAMLRLTASGLLDLWYVVFSDAGHEVSRSRHPDPAPIGQRLTDFRADEPESFVVDDDDVYLMFSPTETLEQLSKVPVVDDPKATGAAGNPPPAPEPQGPTADERVTSSQAWSGGVIHIENIEKLVIAGGDVTGRHTVDQSIRTATGAAVTTGSGSAAVDGSAAAGAGGAAATDRSGASSGGGAAASGSAVATVTGIADRFEQQSRFAQVSAVLAVVLAVAATVLLLKGELSMAVAGYVLALIGIFVGIVPLFRGRQTA